MAGERRWPEAVRARRDLLVVLAIALLLRAIVMFGCAQLPLWTLPEVDAAIFHESARRIAAGDLLLGHDVLRMSPGYFYFLGGVYAWFGDGPLAFRLIQLALGLLTVASTWRTAVLLLGERIGLVVGVALALYEPLAFYENLQVGETLATTLLSIVVWSCVEHSQEQHDLKLSRVAGLGALLGLVCNLRPNALLLALPLALFVWRRRASRPFAQRALGVGLLIVGASATMAPIVARNYLATSELTLTGHLAGLNLFVGNAQGATGSFRAPAEVPHAQGPERQFAAFRAIAERAEGRPLTAKETDAYWRARTFASVREDPAAWLALMFKKTRLFFNGRDLSDVYDYWLLREYSPWLGVPALQFHQLAPFALVGVLLLLTRRELGARYVGWIALGYAASVIIVFVSGRFRVPIVPVLFLAAGACLAAIIEAARARRRERSAALVLALALSVYWTWPAKLKNKSYVESWFTLGQGFHRLSELSEAERAYREALAEKPDHVPSRNNLALLYEQKGQRDAAVREWKALRDHARADSDTARRAANHIARLSRKQSR